MPVESLQDHSLSHLEFLARQVVEGFITGLHKSPFHGFSVEFAEHRLYNTGESTRHIDWKLYGKTDKLFVKRYEEETNLRCQIVLDLSSSMNFPAPSQRGRDAESKLSYSIKCAAALTYLLRRQRDAVGLSTFSDKLELHLPARSNHAHQKNLFHHLEQLLTSGSEQERHPTKAASALHEVAEAIHRRSLVVIFSDMMDRQTDGQDQLFSALQHLRHNKHEVILFHVRHKGKELDFEFENRPYTFIDMESGEQIKLNPAEVKEQYLKRMNEFQKDLQSHCAQYRIDYVEADIEKGYKQVLMPYLVKREKMK